MAAAAAKIRTFDRAIRPFPGVAITLRRLSAAGVELRIHSRAPLGDAEVRRRLERLRLANCIHGIIDDTPHSSDRGSLQSLLARRHVPPASIAYVGCDARQLSHARQLGLHTIAFNSERDASASQVISQFDQLVDAIQPACARARAG